MTWILAWLHTHIHTHTQGWCQAPPTLHNQCTCAVNRNSYMCTAWTCMDRLRSQQNTCMYNSLQLFNPWPPLPLLWESENAISIDMISISWHYFLKFDKLINPKTISVSHCDSIASYSSPTRLDRVHIHTPPCGEIAHTVGLATTKPSHDPITTIQHTVTCSSACSLGSYSPF